MFRKYSCLIGFIVGLIIWQQPGLGVAICLSLLVFLLIEVRKLIVIFFLIGLNIGFLRMTAANYYWQSDTSLLNSQVNDYQGLISQVPRQTTDAQWLTVKYTINNQSIKLLIKTSLYPVYQRGQFISWHGQYQLNSDSQQQDYGNYLQSQGVVAVFFQPPIKLLISTPTNSWLDQLKEKSISIIQRQMIEPESSIMVAYFFGADDLIPRAWQDLYRRVGISHVIAISGMHIMIMAMLLQKFLFYFFLSKKSSQIITMIFLVSYVLMIGNQASALRALLMYVILTIGQMLYRSSHNFYTLLIVAVLTLFWQPLLLFYDLGWQLSFLAVAGLMFLTKYTQQIFFSTSTVAQTLAATLAAMIMTGPWLAYKFAGFSFLAPLANVLVIPAFDFLLSLGLISLLLSFLWPALGTVLLQICWQVIHRVNEIVFWLDKHLQFFWSFNQPSLLMVTITYLLILLFINRLYIFSLIKKSQLR